MFKCLLRNNLNIIIKARTVVDNFNMIHKKIVLNKRLFLVFDFKLFRDFVKELIGIKTTSLFY